MLIWSRSLRMFGLRSLFSGAPWIFAFLVFLISVHAGERPAQLIVGFKPGHNPGERAAALRNASTNSTLARGLGRQSIAGQSSSTELLTLQRGVSVASETARLQQNRAVAYVEPNYSTKVFNTVALVPNDFDFFRQYSLNNSGLPGGKTNGAISATKAWALGTGSKSLVVAVIDTGIDYFHEDLRDNLWHNAREIPSNGIDDDGNSYIDDVIGYDFVSNDSDPFDDNNHGTHVAGIIGAKGNNGIGISGVCWDASLMIVKAFDNDGNGTVADAIAAIHYAVANGARVINASWGLGEKSRALEEAAQFAADSGVLIVAAAGNDRTDAPAYPASFDSVLSVAASDDQDHRASFSNYGPTVDIIAPGADIYSTLPENRYGLESGTSMAAPHVTGVAALVLSRFPNYTRTELFDILVNSFDPVLFDQPVGGGRLNADLAVLTDQPPPTVRLDLPATLSGRREIFGTALGSFFTGYRLRAGAGTYPSEWVEFGSSRTSVTNGVVGIFDSSLIPDGVAQIQLIATNQNGFTATASGSVRLLNAILTSPFSGDVLRPGKYPVRGTVFGAGKSYELLYGSGLQPGAWTTISSGTATASTNELLGEWDTSDLAAGFYALRLRVEVGLPRKFEFTAPAIYIDRELREGWPVYLPVDLDFPPTDWRNVRVADLDGNGQSEVILVDPANRNRPQKLFVYSSGGTLLWSKVLGFDIPPDLPVMGDIDGDGKSELFVDSTNGILAFHFDGNLVAGWPIETRRGNHAKVLADLDRDGKLELITYSQEYAATQVGETRDLAVYGVDGKLVRRWELPWCGFTNAVQKISPAVANIDDDPQLEIVVPSGCQELAAFDYRKPDPKWRVFTQAPILSSPAIGDIDGRGGPDIVVATAIENGVEQGGVYVFDGKGQRWLGWPVLEEYSFTTPPALGDLDNDGRLEIVLSSEKEGAFHVLQWDGFEADGWPKTVVNLTWHNTVQISDVDNDGKPDVLFTAPGYVNLAVPQNRYDYVGGISVYNFAGEELGFSGNDKFKPRLIEGATGRWHRAGPAVICDIDNDGQIDVLSASILDRTFGTYIRAKDRSSIYAWNPGLPFRAENAPWPMFGHDPQNTGAYSLPSKPIPPPTNYTAAIRDRVIAIEDRPVLVEPLVNDWNGSSAPLILTSFAQPTNGLVILTNDTKLIYTPATNYNGFDGFTYSIADELGNSSTGRVLVRIKPVNDRPVAKNYEFTMLKNVSLDIIFEAADAENDPLTFRVLSTPQSGEVWNYPTVASYVPKKGFSGPDYFSYIATDGKLESEPGFIQIAVINSNNPPKSLPSDVLTKTNRSVRINPRGEDPDGDPLTFHLVTEPLNGRILPESGGFRFIPNTNFVGEDSFAFRAFDGTAFSQPSQIKIGVIATNATPRASDGSSTIQPNSTNEFRLSGSDPDGDKIDYRILTLPLHGELLGKPPQITYVPERDYEGPDRFTFKVSDSFAESAAATFNITISRENRPPVAKESAAIVPQDVATAIKLDAFDPDGDPIQTIILKGPARGTIYGSGTNYIYRPIPGYSGGDQFTYKLWDGKKFGKEGRVNISVVGQTEERPFQFDSVRRERNLVILTIRPGNREGYTIQASTNLVDWSLFAGPFRGGAEPQVYSDTNASEIRRFYRAISP